MSYEAVTKALKSLDLYQVYFQNFNDKKLHDFAVQRCIMSRKDETLIKIIPNGDHKRKFVAAFNKISHGPPAEEEKQNTSSKYKTTGCPDDIPLQKPAPSSNDIAMVNAACNMAITFYKDSMKKEFKSTAFKPHFQELCAKYTAEAIAQCRKVLLLTSSQEDEVLKAMKGIKLKYKDKNFQCAPQKSLAIGIDLGTTYSCVSICRNGKVEIIPNEIGKFTTPSCVAFRPDGSVIVGSVAKRAAFQDPQNTAFDSKRLLGRKFEDAEVQSDVKIWPFRVVKSDTTDTPKITIHGKTYFAEEISARILQYMKKIAEKYLSCEVKDVVVTVPAYFNNGQRQATRDAGEIAGLNILKIINEPTAAAIAYNLHRTDDLKKNVLIFDLGGGTLDVALITVSNGEIRNLAVGGDTHLGGQDFDNEMVNHCIKAFKEKHNIDLTDISKAASSRALRMIRNECEQEKINLSATEETVISTYAIYEARFWGSYDLNVPITRQEFNDLCKSKFDRCMDVVKSVLQDSKLKKEDIDEIVLVGGSSRIPEIQTRLSNFFDSKALNISINPDEAVARGAAVQAAILNGKQSSGLATAHTVTINVTPLSLGLASGRDDKMSVLISKNTPIPCSCKQGTWGTLNDGQVAVIFQIYEGEDPIATNNNLLGTFRLENIPLAKALQEKIEVTMEMSDEGILHVRAIVRSNRSYSAITISAYQGRLSKGQISEMKDTLRSE